MTRPGIEPCLPDLWRTLYSLGQWSSSLKQFQVFLSNTNNTIQNYSFIYTQFNGFKLSKQLSSSIWPIEGTLTGIITPGQSGPGSNSNERVLHIPQNSKTEASPSNGLMSYPEHSLLLVVVVESYLSSEVQLVYSTVPANSAVEILNC